MVSCECSTARRSPRQFTTDKAGPRIDVTSVNLTRRVCTALGAPGWMADEELLLSSTRDSTSAHPHPQAGPFRPDGPAFDMRARIDL